MAKDPESGKRINEELNAKAKALLEKRGDRNIAPYYADHITTTQPTYSDMRHDDLGHNTNQSLHKLQKENIELTRAKLAGLSDKELYSTDTLTMIHGTIFHGSAGHIAGHMRSEKEKMHRDGVSFKTDDIPGSLERIMTHMQNNLSVEDQEIQTRDQLTQYDDKFSTYYNLVYLVHPFIDGNTRTTDVFMQEVAHRHGQQLDTNFGEAYTNQLRNFHSRDTWSTHKNFISSDTSEKGSNYKMSNILDKMETEEGWKQLQQNAKTFAQFLHHEGVLRPDNQTMGDAATTKSQRTGTMSGKESEKSIENLGLSPRGRSKESTKLFGLEPSKERHNGELGEVTSVQGLDIKATFNRPKPQQQQQPKEQLAGLPAESLAELNTISKDLKASMSGEVTQGKPSAAPKQASDRAGDKGKEEVPGEKIKHGENVQKYAPHKCKGSDKPLPSKEGITSMGLS